MIHISSSSQRLTAERVLIHADTGVQPDLLSSRFGYVAVPRASHEATIFTDDVNKLGQQLSTEVGKTSALELSEDQYLSTEISKTSALEIDETVSIGQVLGVNCDYRTIERIKLPTRRRVFGYKADLKKIPEPVLVSIDLSDIKFT